VAGQPVYSTHILPYYTPAFISPLHYAFVPAFARALSSVCLGIPFSCMEIWSVLPSYYSMDLNRTSFSLISEDSTLLFSTVVSAFFCGPLFLFCLFPTKEKTSLRCDGSLGSLLAFRIWQATSFTMSVTTPAAACADGNRMQHLLFLLRGRNFAMLVALFLPRAISPLPGVYSKHIL